MEKQYVFYSLLVKKLPKLKIDDYTDGLLDDIDFDKYRIVKEEERAIVLENTLTGNLILTVMLAFAEYERGMIVERTQTGKAVARQDPNFKDGRPKKFKPEQIDLALSLLAQGKTYRQITTMTGISKSTLIRAKRVS